MTEPGIPEPASRTGICDIKLHHKLEMTVFIFILWSRSEHIIVCVKFELCIKFEMCIKFER